MLAALSALLLALALVACGGGGDDSTAADTAGQGSTESGEAGTASGDGSGKSGSGSGGSKQGGDSSGSDAGSGGFKPKQHADSGGGSQQFRVKGGDNSVQDFGEEADDSDFEAAAAALHNFLDARAAGNWRAACSYMSKSIVESFEKLAAQAKEVDATSCAEIVSTLTNPAAKSAMKAEAAKADVGSLRVEGDRSFVIYTGVDGTILAMPMAEEDGEWKVGSLAGTPLN